MIDFLSRIPLFSTLPDDFKAILAAHLERREFPRNAVIVRKGDVGESMFIIASGQVAVVHEEETLGLQFELAQLKPGQVFGEMALLTRENRSATCRAAEATVAFELNRMVFMSLLNRAPQVAIGVCQILAQRIADLNRRQGVQLLDPARLKFDPEVYNLFPPAVLQQHRMIPLSIDGNRLQVATPDPGNQVALDALRRCLPRVDVQPAMISEAEYQRFVERHLKDGRATQGRRPPGPRPLVIQFLTAPDEGKDTASATGDVSAQLNELMSEALDRQASDIHIEPAREGVIIRYRIDGQLIRKDNLLPRALYRPLISRLKVLGGMDIAERRLPQDGRISISANTRVYDLRLSTLPTKGGEKVVMRILDSTSALRPLEELIVWNDVNAMVKKLVHQPYGALIVCGPTGSGKTTTLYSTLAERNTGDCNITTVEDPIEYDVPDVVQVQVNEAIGLTFPAVLRTVLRQDSDVILVGEMRDATTAKMALEAGLSGHLVLTSLHANTTAGTPLRLKEMGTDPFIISNAVHGVICQRLVRRLCPGCTRPTPYSAQIRELLIQDGALPPGYTGHLYGAVGCTTCRDAGFKGRVGVYEVMTMTEAVRSVVSTPGFTAERILEAAQKGGFVSLASYASYLLTNGLTTPQEILRILHTVE
jgi:type IV pilus assembly protein PilB